MASDELRDLGPVFAITDARTDDDPVKGRQVERVSLAQRSQRGGVALRGHHLLQALANAACVTIGA